MKKTTLLLIFLCFAGAAIAQQASISGSVLLPDGTTAPDVTVQLLGDQGQLVATASADGAGRYVFTGIPTGREYTVVPESSGQALYEVSTFDMVIGAQHILGINLLDSPLKLLAGDVNASQSLTTFDLINIRQLVLGTIDSFSRNWLFLRTDTQFFSDDNPWLGFTGGDSSLFLEGDVSGFDFFAVKAGDLSW